MAKKHPTDSGDDLLAQSLGQCIARHREAANVNMNQLAQKAGMARAQLWRIEQGQVIPTFRNVARLAVALEVPIGKLLDGVDTSQVSLESRPYKQDTT